MKNISAAIFGAFALSACSVTEPNPNDDRFDGYQYIGDRTPEAVCQYTQDAKSATVDAIEGVKGVGEIFYAPKEGVVYVRPAEGKVVMMQGARQVMEIFTRYRVYVSGVAVESPAGVRYYKHLRAKGGKSRASALMGIPTTCPGITP